MYIEYINIEQIDIENHHSFIHFPIEKHVQRTKNQKSTFQNVFGKYFFLIE